MLGPALKASQLQDGAVYESALFNFTGEHLTVGRANATSKKHRKQAQAITVASDQWLGASDPPLPSWLPTLIKTDIRARRAVVHIINGLLTPSVAPDDSFSTLVDFLGKDSSFIQIVNASSLAPQVSLFLSYTNIVTYYWTTCCK